jgi:signal transduction histidine kinase
MRPAGARDVGLASAWTLLLLVVSVKQSAHGDFRSIDALGDVLVVVAGMSLALLRRWPRAVFGVVAVAVGVYVAHDLPPGPILLTPLLALLGVSLYSDRRSSAICAGALCAILAVGGLVGGSGLLLALLFVGWCGVPVLIGDVVRRRNEQIAGLRERNRALERSHEEELRRRIAEDRLSIARDLHDSVAHAMTVINVQAGAAAHVVDRRPEAAKGALLSIRRASHDVLDELSAMLSLLREPAAPAARAPVAGLSQVPDLIRELHDDRLTVSVASEGPVDRVPAPISTAAYRIVQESVTNIVRHAQASRAEIRITASEDGELSVLVADDGTGPANGAGAGVGLRGMRERAEASGGRLVAGRAPDGGFRVHATWDGER